MSLSWEQLGPESLYLSDNELSTGARVRVPTERAMSATSGTRALGSPPLAYSINHSVNVG